MIARSAWRKRQPALDVGRLVFLDETGSNAAMARRFGWSKRGERVQIEKPLRAKPVSIIGAMSLTHVVTTMMVVGPVDVGTVLREITAQNCKAWFRHCGYVPQAS